MITKKNSCGSKIPFPAPPPKKNVSSGPSLLNAKVTFSADFLFFSLRLKDYITTLTLTTYYRLGNDWKSDGMHGNPRENGFPWSCSDIFWIHDRPPTKSIANQSLLITAILSRQATRSSGAWQDKTAAWKTHSLQAQPVIVSSRKVPPRKKAREALRDKTKNCCAGLTCRHNNTKSWYCYYSLLLTIWYDESSSQRAEKKITKNDTFTPCALQSIVFTVYSAKVKDSLY